MDKGCVKSLLYDTRRDDAGHFLNAEKQLIDIFTNGTSKKLIFQTLKNKPGCSLDLTVGKKSANLDSLHLIFTEYQSVWGISTHLVLNSLIRSLSHQEWTVWAHCIDGVWKIYAQKEYAHSKFEIRFCCWERTTLLGASPDGRVIDVDCVHPYGIVGIKCLQNLM